ncbi:MAG: geranylgeranylglycerol-phosphate geranylgeranyltransferase [Leadbetterella sp.]
MISFQKVVELIRWKNLGLILLAQLVTVFVFLNPIFYTIIVSYQAWCLFLSCIIISASGYIINDYFDVKIDQVNKPQRVIIGQFLNRRKALLIHQILNVIGITMGLIVGLKIFALNVICVSLLWFYASVFKRRAFIGNMIVAGLLAMVLIEIAWYYDPHNLKIWFYAFLVFIVNLIREIIKDLEDQEGDALHGARTLPIAYGVPFSKNIIYGICVIGILVLTGVMFFRNEPIVLGLIFSMHLFFVFILFKVKKSDRKIHYSFLSSFMKYFLFLGLFTAFLFK